ncbi:hypothetical protein BST81_16830 [Leptolyngbya sp. 'hensonii']|uniref:hypothetical protein n=1 Tax=Leptolyngbya sp. 'hensonii' TaxID=1922337 RepID=UPI00094F8311|nr:hypothetical protein [Leptolyngbya sp. 'hensonii']OLP17454.1 hypothetical protein BST81_16830 [Leptolyngbya sp. 'hensonii']
MKTTRVTALAAVLLALLALAHPIPVLAGPPTQTPTALFQSVSSGLSAVTIPLRLPTYLPAGKMVNARAAVTPIVLYATLERSEPNAYSIVLGTVKGCRATYCRFAYVTGKKRNTEDPTLSTFLAESQSTYRSLKSGSRSSEAPGMVKLADGNQAVFTPWLCGASCSESTITWDEGVDRYVFAVMEGSKADLTKMANSALAQ